MTKKDYELIAKVIRGCQDKSETITGIMMLREVAYQLATFLKKDNPKFDRNKFLKASGWK